MDVVGDRRQGPRPVGRHRSQRISSPPRNQLASLRNQLVNARLQFAASLATLRLVTGTIDPGAEKPDAVAAKFLSPGYPFQEWHS